MLPISFYDISSNDVKITLKSFKRSFLFASLLFLISFVIGYAVSPLADFSQIEGNLDDVVSMISELSPLEIAIFIFLNNSRPSQSSTLPSGLNYPGKNCLQAIIIKNWHNIGVNYSYIQIYELV